MLAAAIAPGRTALTKGTIQEDPLEAESSGGDGSMSDASFVSKQPFTALARAAPLARRNADFVQQWLGIADVTGLTAREEKAQRCPVGAAEHVDFGCQVAATAA